MSEPVLLEARFQGGAVSQIDGREAEICVLLQDCQPILLELYRVVIIEIVDADDHFSGFEESLGEVKSDESGRSSDKNFHSRLHVKQ